MRVKSKNRDAESVIFETETMIISISPKPGSVTKATPSKRVVAPELEPLVADFDPSRKSWLWGC
jgi:hypothetical protein